MKNHGVSCSLSSSYNLIELSKVTFQQLKRPKSSTAQNNKIPISNSVITIVSVYYCTFYLSFTLLNINYKLVCYIVMIILPGLDAIQERDVYMQHTEMAIVCVISFRYISPKYRCSVSGLCLCKSRCYCFLLLMFSLTAVTI